MQLLGPAGARERPRGDHSPVGRDLGDSSALLPRLAPPPPALQWCGVLHHTAPHCTALRGTAPAPHCTPHCTILTVLHYTALHRNALHSTVQHYVALHCTALHRTVLHRTTLSLPVTAPYRTALHRPMQYQTLHIGLHLPWQGSWWTRP